MSTYALTNKDGLVIDVVEVGPGGLPDNWRPMRLVQTPAQRAAGWLSGTLEPDTRFTVVKQDGGKIGDTWNGTAFVSPPENRPPPGPRYVPVWQLRERLEALGKWDAVVEALRPGQLAKLLTLREGVASDDTEAIAVLRTAGVNPDAILAP